MSKTVLVIAAHADDEALGCGGTIARHTADGDAVHLVLMADGVTSRLAADAEDVSTALVSRDSAADQAHAILGIRSVQRLGFPDNRMDSLPLIEIIQRLETIICELEPNIIYTHHHGDLNIDHRITHHAVLTACRPVPGNSVCEIYSFEVMSSTEWATPEAAPFMPNHYVDISKHLNAKFDALRAYQLEMRDAPHSRSIQNLTSLACYRGHTVGVPAAEAFMVLRVVR